jgi:FkbM family methyltransferase
VLWDIGANVGVYSLYAALKPHVRVLAFEPSSSNYYVLNRNININRMDKKIQALCIAFNNETNLDYLYKVSTEIGGSGRFFAETTDFVAKEFTPIFTQGMIGFSIDNFIKLYNPPFPNHIKIDVDGIENKIIQGAHETLVDNRLKSILIELNSSRVKYYQEVIANLERAGLRLSAKYHPNHIFVRD